MSNLMILTTLSEGKQDEVKSKELQFLHLLRQLWQSALGEIRELFLFKYHKEEILYWYYCFSFQFILKASGRQGSLQHSCQIYSTYIKFKAPHELPF